MTEKEIRGWIRTYETYVRNLRSLPFLFPSQKHELEDYLAKIAKLKEQLKKLLAGKAPPFTGKGAAPGGRTPMLVVLLIIFGLAVCLRNIR